MNTRLAAATFVRSVAGISAATMLLTGSPVLSAASQRLPVVIDVTRDSKTEFAVFSMPEVLWKCEGRRCVGTVEPRPAAAMTVCKGVARKMIRVIAFKVADRSFDESELLACNGGKVVASTQ